MPRPGWTWRWSLLLVSAAVVVLAVAAALLLRFEHAPLPSRASVLNPERLPLPAFDHFGREIGAGEAAELRRTAEGRRLLEPANGAVRIDEELARHGREAFYRETFGNEVFLSDVMGLLDGALSPWAMTRAVLATFLQGTDDLTVRLARDKQVGDRLYRAGEVVSTGLDIPSGGLFPLGVKVVWDRGRVRAGITCAACHARVDPATGRVVEGAPNANLDTGLVMALAANSAAYFMHTSMPTLDRYLSDDATVVDSTGEVRPLPAAEPFETAVAGMLAAWPPGSFDSTLDLVNNPSQIPDSFTAGDHPYGWSGFAAAGAFRGLSMLANNVHGLNSDATNEVAAAPTLFGIDPEVLLGTLLQRAPAERFRYDPAGARKPSAVLAAADPTATTPGLNRVVRLPTYPHASFMSSNGLVATVPGRRVAYDLDAMSAFQQTLLPPPAAPGAGSAAGREVFERAGCGECHGGAAYSANRVVPAGEIGTQPSRARALAGTGQGFQPPWFLPPSVMAPPPGNATLIRVPIPPQVLEGLKLGWAQDAKGQGGYKTKGLVGLAWSAPYLHDGGVAVGAGRELGLPGTVMAGIPADPANSLLALIDRELRGEVVAANAAAGLDRDVHASGAGHEFWVDPGAGYTAAEQRALIGYLLALDRPRRDPVPE